MKFLLIFIIFIFLNPSFANELKFGIYTSDKPTEMYKKFKPIIDYLENALSKKGLTTKISLKWYRIIAKI